jgi:hypothetical protein
VIASEGGEVENPLINPHAAAVLRAAREEGSFTEIPFGRRLPDGGTVHLFERSTGLYFPVPAPAPVEFSIGFGGELELTSLLRADTPGRIVVKYGWRCLRAPERDYWCFTHLVDGQGKPVGFLDHELLEGDPPARTWRPGATAAEQRVYRLPPGVDPRGLRLRLGLYDPGSGRRLRVEPLSGPAATRFAITDDGTAVLEQVR